jgi:hypothetical protein
MHLQQLFDVRRNGLLPRSPPAACGTAENTSQERLLPMPLPPDLVVGGHTKSSRRRKRQLAWHTSSLLTEMYISMFNVWEIDAIVGQGGRPPTIGAAPSELERAAFLQLREDVLRIIRPNLVVNTGLGRGTIVLCKLFEHLSGIAENDVSSVSDLLVAAEAVDAEALRLPASAGHLKPADFLPASQAHMFEDMANRLLPPENRPELVPHPCFMVSPAEQRILRRRLMSAKMTLWLPESEIARREDGRLLLNGCFAVPHRKGQRAIFYGRPANAGEARLRWATLPNGPMLCDITLKRDEVLRASGDDLENYFYQWAEAESAIPRRAFGRRITGAEAVALGGQPGVHYRLALRVLGMGSLNAPDVAQKAHETA